MVRFRVPIIDDDCFEKDEYFWVHIYAVEQNIHIYRHQYVTVHIYSDDGKLIVIYLMSKSSPYRNNLTHGIIIHVHVMTISKLYVLQRCMCPSLNMSILRTRMKEKFGCTWNCLEYGNLFRLEYG